MGRAERFYADIMAVHPGVTGSCNLVIVKMPNEETIRFVVDCGLFQEKNYEEFNSTLPFNPENLDFCLITHNHVDHTGRLPLLVNKDFQNKFYATETTCKLLPYALNDSFKVLRDVSKRKNKKCLYNEANVSKVLSMLVPSKYNQEIIIGENVKVTFFNNGHLMGAAVILVQISYPQMQDINLLFTGDYNSHNVFFDVLPIPEWVKELPLTVIQESTYGDMDTSDMEQCFEVNVIKCLENDGTVVSPVFSLGRAQEIMYVLKRLQDKKVLSEDIPIYFDGKLGIKYTELYIKDGLDIKQEMRNFLPKNMTFVDKTTRGNVLKDIKRKIILTTSGMGSYGPAQLYIPEYVKRKNALIHFTGYTAEGTMGRKLKNTETGQNVEFGGLIIRKVATVEYTKEYSAHAKADEMIEFLKQFKKLKLVLVNHGEEMVKKQFASRILNEINPKAVGILGRDYFFRVSPYGLIKSLSTKFE